MNELKSGLCATAGGKRPSDLPQNGVLSQAAVVRYPRLCIVTELCHRGSLYHILNSKDKPLSWPRRISIALDAARGLSFLHTHEPCIVHLDMKSPNLFVDRSWNCRLGDFGLARTKRNYYVSNGCGSILGC